MVPVVLTLIRTLSEFTIFWLYIICIMLYAMEIGLLEYHSFGLAYGGYSSWSEYIISCNRFTHS